MYVVLHVLSKRFNITPVVCDLATGTGSFRSEMECIEQYDVCVLVCMYICMRDKAIITAECSGKRQSPACDV